MRNLLLLNFFLFVFDEWWGVDADGWSSDRFTHTMTVNRPRPRPVSWPTNPHSYNRSAADNNFWICYSPQYDDFFKLPAKHIRDLLLSGTGKQKTEDILEFIFGIFLLILVCYGITKLNYYFPNNISIFKSHLIVIFFLKFNMTHILFLSNLTRQPLQNTSGWMTMKKLSIQKRFVELKAQYCTFYQPLVSKKNNANRNCLNK